MVVMAARWKPVGARGPSWRRRCSPAGAEISGSRRATTVAGAACRVNIGAVPVLKITRAAFAPENLRTTTEYLLGVMLWPTDESRRADYLRTCDVVRRADLVAAVPGAFTAEDLAASFQEAAIAHAPDHWRGEMLSRMHRGTLVGLYFYGCWNRAVLGERVIVKQLHALMTTPEVRARHPSADISPKTLEAYIRDFRSVGPLWAASIIFRLELAEPFPPRTPDSLVNFFGVAEHARRLAAMTPLQERSEPLLPIGVDVWRPPPWLDLPELKLVQTP